MYVTTGVFLILLAAILEKISERKKVKSRTIEETENTSNEEI